MWPTRAGATADRRQKQQQRGAVSSTAQQRGAAVQQSEAQSRTSCFFCLLWLLGF